MDRDHRNLAVLCDGTGNEISENISNVLKFYRCLRKTEKTSPRQLVYYDPGVGTLARPDSWHWLAQDFNLVLGLTTGYGLDDNVLAAYQFLVNHYQDGDQIYLFGFSRGAYTARVLAGLIHKIGLISPEQVNLAGSGLVAYKQLPAEGEAALAPATPAASAADGEDEAPLPASRFDLAAQFARITSPRLPTIRFVGVWDTVASVIVPRSDRFYLPSLEELAFVERNPSVKAFRQAISIDERRRMYRLKRWDEPQLYRRNRFIADDRAEPQDSRQVWFAGVHGDIGGGYPEAQSALSKFPLLWMIGEAAAHDLRFNTQMVKQLAWGVPRKGSPYVYVAPDAAGPLHDSLTPAWRLLEYFPKQDRYKEWPARESRFGFYIPDAEPRLIPDGAVLHESVVKRMADVPAYRPVNLPASYQVAPMPAWPEAAEPEAAEFG